MFRQCLVVSFTGLLTSHAFGAPSARDVFTDLSHLGELQGRCVESVIQPPPACYLNAGLSHYEPVVVVTFGDGASPYYYEFNLNNLSPSFRVNGKAHQLIYTELPSVDPNPSWLVRFGADFGKPTDLVVFYGKNKIECDCKF